MIKNNKSYTGPNGKTYGPEHYKKAVEYDKKQLQRIQKKEKLANAMSKAGVGKGIAGAINGDAVKKVASDLGKGIAEGVRNMAPKARTGVSKEMAKGLSRGLTGAISGAATGRLTSKVQRLRDAERSALEDRAGRYQVRGLNAGKEKQDAAKERQVASRYKGNFDPRKVVPEGGPQPGVTSRGSFSLCSKKKKR